MNGVCACRTTSEAMLEESCLIVLGEVLLPTRFPCASGCPLVTPVCRRIGHAAGTRHQYLAICYADTLATAGAVASVRSVGDSYDNVLAESTIGQIKAELIHRRGPWRTVEQLEFAVFEYLDWWNHRRLHSEIGMLPPAEAEANPYPQTQPLEAASSQ